MQEDAPDVLDAQSAGDLGRQEPGGEGAAEERLDLTVEASDAELGGRRAGWSEYADRSDADRQRD